MNAAFSRCIVAAALLGSARLASADFVLITDEEARRPRQFIATLRSGALPAPIIEVFGPREDAPVASPISFTVKFTARAGAAVNMDSVTVTYMVSDLVDLTARLRRFMVKDQIRVSDAIVPPGKHQIRISVQDSNGESRRMFYTFCITSCVDSPKAGKAAPPR